MSFDLGDYVGVNERVLDFYDKYPEGSIQSSKPRTVRLDARVFIEVTSTVYRNPEDPRPAIATAWEPYPGKTNYTKDSEMMNAETSAVGRALAALGIKVNRSMASRTEVENRQVPEDGPLPDAWLARWMASREAMGHSASDIEEMVLTATEGRTADLSEMFASEGKALNAAAKKWVAAHATSA